MPLKLNSSGGGSVTLDVPSTASDFTATMPANTGTVVTDGATQTLTNKTLNSPTISGTPVMSASVLTLVTAQNSTSGTSIDFTGIPSWVRRISVMFNGVSTNGSSNMLVRLGAGSIATSGYTSQSVQTGGASTHSVSTAGFLLTGALGNNLLYNGTCQITYFGSDIWTCFGVLAGQVAGNINYFGGVSSLGGTIDRVRITTVNGTDAFDAGSINIMYE